MIQLRSSYFGSILILIPFRPSGICTLMKVTTAMIDIMMMNFDMSKKKRRRVSYLRRFI